MKKEKNLKDGTTGGEHGGKMKPVCGILRFHVIASYKQVGSYNSRSEGPLSCVCVCVDKYTVTERFRKKLLGRER